MDLVYASSSSFTFAGDGIKDGSASSPSSSDSNQTNPTGEQQQWTQQSNQTVGPVFLDQSNNFHILYHLPKQIYQ